MASTQDERNLCQGDLKVATSGIAKGWPALCRVNGIANTRHALSQAGLQRAASPLPEREVSSQTPFLFCFAPPQVAQNKN
jgi:hypothetical protein